MTSNLSSPVCVTGAAGFIASHVVAELLARGHRVRGTARDPNSASCEHLRRMPGANERLELVAADLLDEQRWPEVVAGCARIIHMASPYVLEVKDPQRDLVDPAVKGTRLVLEAALAAGVERVVLTSSMAAITDEPDEEHVLSEDDWNTKSSLERNPYYYSKTLAEREAWRIVGEHRRSTSLVVINPFLVIGPSYSSALNTSNQLFADLLNGVYPGIMRLVWGFVDVRDVASAHVEALTATSARGRYICAAGTMGMRELVELLQREGYGNHALPRLGLDCSAGDFAVRLSSYFQPRGLGSYLRTHVGRVPRFATSKIRSELGVTFRPLTETIRDTVADVARHRHLKSIE
jgi:dihydroflavonol-4-reductase